jgi:aminopeptidase N
MKFFSKFALPRRHPTWCLLLIFASATGCKHDLSTSDTRLKDDEHSNVPSADYRELENKPPHLSNGRIDVKHYNIDLQFKSMTTKEVSAQASIKLKLLKPDKYVRLHMEDSTISVQSTALDQKNKLTPTKFSVIQGQAGKKGLSGSILKVELPATLLAGEDLTIEIKYTVKASSANSHRGMYFKESFEDAAIFNTRNWPYYARFWLPSNDHPADTSTFNIKLAVPPETVGVANGQLAGGDYKNGSGIGTDGLRHFEWSMATPIPTYSLSITIAKLDVVQEEVCFNPKAYLSGERVTCNAAAAKIPFVYYVQKRHSDKNLYLKQAHEGIRQMILMSSFLGSYPYQKLGFVTAPHPFNMESASMIVMISPEATTHEVAHHWWGNSVYIEHWGDLWISEGLTTYFTGFYDEIFTGKYTGCKQSKGLLNNPKETDPLDIFNDTPYCKGAAAIADLRATIENIARDAGKGDKGRDGFLLVMRHLYENYQFKRLGSDSLIKFLRENMKNSLAELKISTQADAVDRALNAWEKKWFDES